MKTSNILTLLLAFLIGGISLAQNTFGEIIGTLMTPDQKEGVFGAYVYTNRGDEVYRTITDEDGRFKISAVPAGMYQVYFVYEKDTIKAPDLVEVVPDGYGNTGIVTTQKVTELDGAIVTAPIYRLRTGVTPEIKLTAKDIKHMPNKFDPKSMVASMTSEVQLKDDGSLVFRGARKGDMLTYLDGVKIRDLPAVPSASIGYMMVYTGAIPAKYGDTMGGIVVIETVSYFDLLREWQARQ